MVNWKKVFFIVGLPLLAFYIFLIIIFYAFISTLFFLVLIMGVCCLRFSKEKIYPGLTKLSIAMILFFTLMISNPLYWPAQIHRHLDTSLVITPNHPDVMQLNSTASGYLWDYLSQGSTNITPDIFYNDLTDHERLTNMTDFVLDEIIIYNFIPEVYGVIDYVSTPSEAIGHGRGDCHSRTIVMVSFFIHMGYDAWACETPFHWYTCVYLGPNHTNPHYYYREVLENYNNPGVKINWTDPQIMFNHEEVIFSMNFFERLGDTVFGIPFYNKIYELFSIKEMQIALWPIVVGVGFLMTTAIRITSTEEKRIVKNGLFASLIMVLGFFIALSLSHVLFPGLLAEPAVFITMIASVILAAQAVQSDSGGKLFSKKE